MGVKHRHISAQLHFRMVRRKIKRLMLIRPCSRIWGMAVHDRAHLRELPVDRTVQKSFFGWFPIALNQVSVKIRHNNCVRAHLVKRHIRRLHKHPVMPWRTHTQISAVAHLIAELIKFVSRLFHRIAQLFVFLIFHALSFLLPSASFSSASISCAQISANSGSQKFRSYALNTISGFRSASKI